MTQDLSENILIDDDTELPELLCEAEAEDPAVYKAPLEAVLFASGRALSLKELSKAAFCSRGTAKKAVKLLMEEYAEKNGGILIRDIDGSYQMCTNPAYYESLIRLIEVPKKPSLTDVLMETLSIIAYNSPVTKSRIERIRGGNSDHAVNRLIEYGMCEECGRLDVPGRPAVFRVTEEFYRRFGLSGKDDLPLVSEDVKALIAEEAAKEAGEAIKVGV